MNRFDKLKIVAASADYINNIDKSKFETCMKDGIITCYRYSNQSRHQPECSCQLFIEKDIIEDEVIIEFTGKILGEHYPDLINKTNIRQCLENINALGVCTLDIDAILKEGKVVKADVTHDVEHPNLSTLHKEIKSCIKNTELYKVKKRKDNLTIEKDTLTKDRKRRLTIYDKEREMDKAKNKRWLKSHGEAASNRMREYFKGKIRFEMNLNTMDAIRDELNIQDTSISTVLESDNNPIMQFLDEILIDNDIFRDAKTPMDVARLALLEKCGYDMEVLRRQIDRVRSPNSHITRILEPYRQLLNGLYKVSDDSLKTRLRMALLEIFLIGLIVSI